MAVSDFDTLFASAGQQNGIDPDLLKAIALQESSGDPTKINKASGAAGLMQFVPRTAQQYGIDPMDPAQAIPAAAKLLSNNLARSGSLEDALAAYGGAMSPDTREAYLSAVAGRYHGLKAAAAQATPAAAAPQQSGPMGDVLAALSGTVSQQRAPASEALVAAPAQQAGPMDDVMSALAAAQQPHDARQPAQPRPAAASPQATLPAPGAGPVPAQPIQQGERAPVMAFGGAMPPAGAGLVPAQPIQQGERAPVMAFGGAMPPAGAGPMPAQPILPTAPGASPPSGRSSDDSGLVYQGAPDLPLERPGGDLLDSVAYHTGKIPLAIAQKGAALFGSKAGSDAVNRMVDAVEAEQAARPVSFGSAAGTVIGSAAPLMLTGAGALLGRAGEAVGGAVKAGVSAIPVLGRLGGIAGLGANLGSQGGLWAGVADPVAGVNPQAFPHDSPVSISSLSPVSSAQAATPGSPSSVPLQGVSDLLGKTIGHMTESAKFGLLLGSGANAIRSGAAPLVDPVLDASGLVARWAQKVAGDKAQQIAEALRNYNRLVPDSVPTTAQVWSDPALAQAEKAVINNPEVLPQFAQRGVENNAARWNAINNLAQSPKDIQAAQVVRGRAATGVLDPTGQARDIDEALRAASPVPVAPVLDQINATLDSGLGQRPVIRRGLEAIRTQIERSVGSDGTMRPDLLDGIRQNAMDFLAQYAPGGVVGTQEHAAMGPIKSAIEGTLKSSIPGYNEYLTAYAESSRPINDMQAAQDIAERLSKSSFNVGGQPQITFPGYKAALARILSGSDYPLSDEASTILTGIQQDLQRATGGANAVPRVGSDTSYNLQAPGWLGRQLWGDNLAQKADGLASHLPVFGKVAGPKVQQELAKALLDPNLMAQYLTAPPSSTAVRNALLAQQLYRAAETASKPQGQ